MTSFGPIIGDALASFALITPSNNRSIGTLYPDCAVEEVHRDEAQITMHPVETGSPVNDHAFMLPQILELRWFWSNSTVGAAGYVQTIYQQLLALQRSFQLQDISTGKRQYTNMAIRSVLVKTDPETENALALVAIAQEVIFTSVTQTNGSPNSNGSSQVGNVSDPPTSDTLNAQSAASAGFATDAQGNVSFPNGIAPGGTVQLQGITAPSWGQTAASINPGTF